MTTCNGDLKRFPLYMLSLFIQLIVLNTSQNPYYDYLEIMLPHCIVHPLTPTLCNFRILRMRCAILRLREFLNCVGLIHHHLQLGLPFPAVSRGLMWHFSVQEWCRSGTCTALITSIVWVGFVSQALPQKAFLVWLASREKKFPAVPLPLWASKLSCVWATEPLVRHW